MDIQCGNRSNIVLIGMPGAGKSTVGVILAKQTSRSFIDTDILIQTIAHRSLQELLDDKGYRAFRELEEEVLLGLQAEHSVIATGGSAVYSAAAMQHLKAQGIVVFLDVDLLELRQRITDFETRGIARKPDQTLTDLFNERYQLYRRYADITIVCAGLTHEQISARIIEQLDEMI